MRYSYPSQRLQDWLSQCACIATGRRIEPSKLDWLMGPFGNVDVIEDRYVEDLAKADGLTIEKNLPGMGILDPIDCLDLDQADRARVHPKIIHFYEHTLDYEFEVWTQWGQVYKPFAGLLVQMYSRRLQQLNLPLQPLDTSRGIRSQIYKLVDQGGHAHHTIWYRHLKSTGEVIYSGIYGSCALPTGEKCLKVVFPLPRGNATVIMRPTVDESGALVLTSKGSQFGDPGFYFLLTNSRGKFYARYLPTLQESIRVFVDDEDVLRADHTLSLRKCKALHIHYRMNPIAQRS
jgi:hypothetical protein